MKRTTTLAIAATLGAAALTTAALTAGTNTPADPDTAGFTPFTVDAPHHDRDINGAIWFPTRGDGSQATFAENGVFYGVPIAENATIGEGQYPVVLLSHGMGGHFRTMAWLGTALAEQGAIVVAVNHPNSSWGDFDIVAGINHWTRAQDMTLALDTLLANRDFSGHIDTSRIMAAGFSYGGWSALSVGGLLGDHAGYVSHCTEYRETSSHCDDLMSAEIQLADMPRAQWDASYKDPRITHVFAVDPGLIWGMSADNVENLPENLRLVALGMGEDRLLATDFDMSGFADLVPDAAITRFSPASHFMFLPLCKPDGAAILIAENDDPVCTDPEGANRAALHDAAIDLIVSDLGL